MRGEGPPIVTAAPSNGVAFLSIAELLSHYRRTSLSPVEALAAVLERIDRHNSTVNAYCYLDIEGARQSAIAAQARWMAGAPKGLLDGVPVGIKDNLLVAGMPARFGSRLTSGEPSAHDAPAIARLREQGAILIGKTTMPEFGWKAVTDSPLTGVTRNPWHTGQTPGGSSGGAVAALVLGMGYLQIGTDGGGSIRRVQRMLRDQGHPGARAGVAGFAGRDAGSHRSAHAVRRRCGAGAYGHRGSGSARCPRLELAGAGLSHQPRRWGLRSQGRVLAPPRLRQTCLAGDRSRGRGRSARIRGARRPRRAIRSGVRRRSDRPVEHVVVVISRDAPPVV